MVPLRRQKVYRQNLSLFSIGLHDIVRSLQTNEATMSTSNQSDAGDSGRDERQRWKKEMLSATRERGRKHFWIGLAVSATLDLRELDGRHALARGMQRQFAKGRREGLVVLRRLAIHRAQLEGATRAEIVESLPLSPMWATRLFSKEEELTRTVEKQVWRRVTKRLAQQAAARRAFARGETPSGYKLPNS